MFKLNLENLCNFLSSFLSLFAPPKLNVKKISKYDLSYKLQCIKININLSPILLYVILGNDSLRSNSDIELHIS
jgi:hypothetical protein